MIFKSNYLFVLHFPILKHAHAKSGNSSAPTLPFLANNFEEENSLAIMPHASSVIEISEPTSAIRPTYSSIPSSYPETATTSLPSSNSGPTSLHPSLKPSLGQTLTTSPTISTTTSSALNPSAKHIPSLAALSCIPYGEPSIIPSMNFYFSPNAFKSGKQKKKSGKHSEKCSKKTKKKKTVLKSSKAPMRSE